MGILIFKNDIHRLFQKPFGLSFELFGNKFEVNPSQGGKNIANHNKIHTILPVGGKLEELSAHQPIPDDYLFLTHISFLREKKQEDYKSRTNVNNMDHYDIRVVVDSYYQGAVERIMAVKYVLHEAYPKPIYIRCNHRDHFMLKEIANGAYVLQALVWLKDIEKPLYLRRHISLYKTEKIIWEKWLKKNGSKPHS